jgi:hypothetical protein
LFFEHFVKKICRKFQKKTARKLCLVSAKSIAKKLQEKNLLMRFFRPHQFISNPIKSGAKAY